MKTFTNRAIYRHTVAGYLVEVTERAQGFVVYCNAGGGFSHKMDAARFDAMHVLVNGPLPFKPVVVHLDEGPGFQGFATEDRWNGFVKPYFLPEVAQAVADFVGLRFDPDTKGYVDPSDEDSQAYPFTPETINVDGVELSVYGIGAGSWVWSLSQDTKEPVVKPEVGFQISATIKPDADNSDCEFIAQMLATTPVQREWIRECVNERSKLPDSLNEAIARATAEAVNAERERIKELFLTEPVSFAFDDDTDASDINIAIKSDRFKLMTAMLEGKSFKRVLDDLMVPQDQHNKPAMGNHDLFTP